MRPWRIVLAAVGVAALVDGGGAGRLCGEDPPPSRPPWQRLLQGDDAKKAGELQGEVTAAQQAGKWEEAVQAAQELLDLRQKMQGKDHWEVADARWQVEALRVVQRQSKALQREYASLPECQQQADALIGRGRYREAQPILETVLEVSRKVLGEEHPFTGRSYNNVAFSLDKQGKYVAAEASYRKGLAINRKLLGEDHPDTATNYNNVAFVLREQGKYAVAEEGFAKALAIRRKVLGEEHPATAKSYNNVAANLESQGKYREAEEGYRKALDIKRRVLGEEHPDTAFSYNNVASNLQAQGKYTAAAEGFRKALAIRRKVLGEEHPDTADSYGNLAFNLNAQGQLAAAEETYQKALAIRRKVLGEEHPDTADSYGNLALNLASQGKYAAAEEGYRKALAISRKVLGEEHPDTASSYNNVASNLNAQGNYAAAEEGFRKALDIKRKVLGEKHPSTATGYDNLAGNLHKQGKCAEAAEEFRKALDIRLELFGEKHPDTAFSYNNLAVNLAAQGKYAAAQEAYRKTLEIRLEVLGAEHPDAALSYRNLGFSLYAQGKFAEAERSWLRSAEAFTTCRPRLARSGLERAAFTTERSPLPALAIVLARNGKPALAWRRYEEAAARGTWDDLSARLRRPAREQARQAALVARLDGLDQLLTRALAVKEETAPQKAQREDLLGQRRAAQEELDAFVARLEKTYGPAAGEVFDIPRIQAALGDDTALVGWIYMNPAGPDAGERHSEHWAFLLRSQGEPVCVRLSGSGPGGAWTTKDKQLPADLRTAAQERADGWERLARRLSRQRLGPLSKHLAAHDSLPAVKHLVVLPSWVLAGVPVELLAEGYTVSYAHSGTLFAHLRSLPKVKTQGLFALADPVFASATATAEKPLPPGGVLLTAVQPGSNAVASRLRPGDVLLTYNGKPLSSAADLAPLIAAAGDKPVPVTVWREGKTREGTVGPGKLGVVLASKSAPEAIAEQRRLDRRLSSRGEEWRELPGTRAEVAALTRLFGDSPSPRVLTDSEASEQKLYELAQSGELKKCRYLHLATHGEVNERFPLRSAVILSRDALPDPGKQLLEGEPVFDGRLTAEEVLRQWNLDCDLVTLSACQTALGKYERGEGFVGFAQALTLCGSRSVCLSLWQVDDAATALLMQRFYANLLGKREGLKAPLGEAEALAEAKRWLRTLPREQALKHAAAVYSGIERGKGRPKLPVVPDLPKPMPEAKEDCPYAHPYYWAAFIHIGDPQ
jgi:tetratricopeptide (TPR) repeat protein